MWVVVTSVEPLRAYLFKGGVLPFGTLKDTASSSATCSAGGELKPCQSSCHAECAHCSVLHPIGESQKGVARDEYATPNAGHSVSPVRRSVKGAHFTPDSEMAFPAQA